MARLVVICLVLALVAVTPFTSAPPGGVRVASKEFTESVILGEIAAQLVRAGGDKATHLAQLGGTRLVFDALVRGEIDAYPEYTGTLQAEIFAGRDANSLERLQQLLRDKGVVMSGPLGFSNNYALAVRRDTAERLDLDEISDLVGHSELRLGLSNEFMDRADGWQNLRGHYGLANMQAAGMNHDLAYEQLKAGTIDVTDAYTTDARLAELDLVLLEDDLAYFTSYDAVLLSRVDLEARFPKAAKQLIRLKSQITPADIIGLNSLVQSRKANEAQAAAGFLRDKFSVEARVEAESTARQIWQRTLEHCDLVRRSLIPAIFVAVPLGVLAAKRPRVGRVILGAAGIVQTIPALALLVLLIAPLAYFRFETLGAGSATAIAALFLYSLLPIVQNTATGLTTIPPEYHESAEALGLSAAFRLLHIELPLASPSILAGIKTATVLNVGFATLGALVGARGYGQPILTGIRLNNTGMILQGAVPAACLALGLQLAFELLERRLIPAGLRPDAANARANRDHTN